MAGALTIVLAHDITYTHVLSQWCWLSILARVNKEFADTVRPWRMDILRKMCANDRGPLLWPSKAKALFGCGRELMRSAALPRGLSFEAINAGFLQHQMQYTKQTELQLLADYQRLCEENKRQKQINEEIYDHRNMQANAEMDRERKAAEALLQSERAASKAKKDEMLRCLQANDRFSTRIIALYQRRHEAREANFAQWAQRHQQAAAAHAKLFNALCEFRDDRIAALKAKGIALAHGAAFLELYDLQP